MKSNEIKKEINNIKKLVSEQVDESEKLKENVKSAINSFIRLETLYKIKCKELEIAKEQLAQARKETAREIFAELQGYYHQPSDTIILDIDAFYKLAKQYGVEAKE